MSNPLAKQFIARQFMAPHWKHRERRHSFVWFASITILSAACTIESAGATDRRYRVYKSDLFGNKENVLEPDAVIEIDKGTGKGFVYEADPFGNADTFSGPKYVIEADKIVDPFEDHYSDEPCDDAFDLRRQSRRR